MTIFVAFFEAITKAMSQDFIVYDYKFSFMDLFLFSLFAGILAGFIGRLRDLFA